MEMREARTGDLRRDRMLWSVPVTSRESMMAVEDCFVDFDLGSVQFGSVRLGITGFGLVSILLHFMVDFDLC